MPRRSFALPSKDDNPDPPIIELTYKVLVDEEWVEQSAEFTCLPYLPAIALRYLVDRSATLASIAFIDRCIASDMEAARFMDMVNDRNVMLRGEELGDVLEWLSAEYAGRDPKLRYLLPSGQTPTGDTLTGNSDSPEAQA